MYKILKNIIEMDDYSVQKLSNQPPEPFEWNTVEGTELNVSDCIGGKGKIEGKGNTYQKQLSGKNLWGGFSYSRTASGVTHIYNKDGTFTINGTATVASDSLMSSEAISEGIYKTFPAGTYTISGGTSEVLLYVVGTKGNTIANTSSTTFTKSFTLTEETNLFIRTRVNKGVTVNNATVYCMVESGSTATDYEPYCGGQPSPNPDYPQPIKVVTGNNVIRHVGKNEFYGGNINTIWYNSDSGKFTRSTTFKSVIMKVKPNTQYVISKKNASNRFAIVTSQSEPAVGNYYKRLVVGYNASNTSYAFKTENDENYILFGVYNGTDETEIAKAIEEIQLEEGSTPTQYEPYRGEDYNLNLGSIELCKIGNYQDTMFKNEVGDENYNAELENGAWYKKGVIDKIAGSDNFATNGIDTNKIDFLTPVLNVEGNLQANTFSQMCCCNLLQTVMTNYTGINGTTSSKKIRIAVSKEYASTYDEAKQLLADIVIYYIQETPTYTKITDTTLISQLEALRKFKWFRGVNHIWTETDNLDPVLAGTYKQSIQSETQNSIANLQVQANEQSISNTPESEV